MRRSWSRLTSGRRSTPRTTLKMAALAPMPSASVSTTVKVSPLALTSERNANLRSVIGSPPPRRRSTGTSFDNTVSGCRAFDHPVPAALESRRQLLVDVHDVAAALDDERRHLGPEHAVHLHPCRKRPPP